MKIRFIVFSLILIIVAAMIFSACSANGDDDNGIRGQESGGSTTSGDTLIVFFSRPGENWQVGNVSIGNTEVIVDYIVDEYSFDSFKIEPIVPYPTDYYETLEVVKQEQESNARPEYHGVIENFDEYQNIILGYPIWNGTIPNIVMSFLEDYDLSGKTVYPFSTHGGSGLGSSISEIRSFEPDAHIGTSFTIAGTEVRSSSAREKTIEWIDSLGITSMDLYPDVVANGTDDFSTDQIAVLNAYMALGQAMIDKDAQAMRDLISEDAQIVHMTGVVQTRDEWIEEIVGGELNYYRLTLDNIVIRIEGEIAYFSADSVLEAAVYGGGRIPWNMHPSQTFVKEGGVWKRA